MDDFTTVKNTLKKQGRDITDPGLLDQIMSYCHYVGPDPFETDSSVIATDFDNWVKEGGYEIPKDIHKEFKS
jgi:hypothetical protein